MSLAQLFYLKESIRHRVRRRFPRKPVHRSSGFTMESLENRLLLSMTPVAPDLSNVIMDATNLEPNPITQAASPDQAVTFQLDYQDTGSGTGTTGLGLRIHYNSSQLIPGEAGPDGQWGTADDVQVLTDMFAGSATTGITGPQDQADTNNDDGDASTDRFLLIEWTDNPGQFPMGPAELLIANWTTAADFTGTTVNFTTPSLPIGRTLNATPAEFTLAQQDVDSDGDGISDPVEAGDNNNDGTPDAQQANVASLLDFSGANRVTFWTRTEGTFFTNMQAVATPADAPADVTLPFGAFSYQVNGLTPGNAAHVQVILPNGSTVNNFYKFGPEAGNTTPHWYSFDYDTTTRAGVIFDPAIQLFLRDGQRGDSDLEANGVIVDPIAPALDPNAPGLIVGNVWSDVNRNAQFDKGIGGSPAESGVNGWTVFIDQNLNGVLDQGEPTSVTADFDVNSDGQIVPWQERGVFTFDNMAAGTYRIRLLQDQPGWQLTFPDQPFIDVTLTAGVISKNNLFGVNQNVAPTAVDDVYTVSQDSTLTIGFNLVKDIMVGSGGANPSFMTNVNGTLFFTAEDGIHGAELWKSDGTEVGTLLVKDIVAGSGWSYPFFLNNVNGMLFFVTDDGITGQELWKSDGTAAGTVLVKDILAGSSGASPNFLTNVNGILFFTAYDDINGVELWKSDGTEAGTLLVKDIAAGSGWSNPYNLINVNGTLFFTAEDGITGRELWKSDGTEAGTVLVKDIFAGGGWSYPINLTDVNGTLFFTADDGINGLELWKSDGTEVGTLLVKDIWVGGGSYPNYLTNVNGTLFFTADDGMNGPELWKSDGTAAGTVLVKDIWAGSGGSYPGGLINVNGSLFCTAFDDINGVELWKSDGTEPGTVLVKDISAGSGWSTPSNLTNVNGRLFFTAEDGIHGVELWKSDGTEAGTVLVEDIASGSGSSSPTNLANVNGTLFFTADDGVHGIELWKSGGVLNNDSDPDSLALAAQLVSGPAHGTLTLNPDGTFVYTPTIGFAGTDTFTYQASDGTNLSNSATVTITVEGAPVLDAIGNQTIDEESLLTFTATASDVDAGQTLTFSLANGASGFVPTGARIDPDTGLFTWTPTEAQGPGVYTFDVVVTDNGSPALSDRETIQITVNEVNVVAPTAVDDAYTVSQDSTLNIGNIVNLVKDINLIGEGSYPSSFTDVDGTLFFAANNGTNGSELWKSDGTEAGTVLVKDIVAGSKGVNLYGLTNVNGTLFFVADDYINGAELWKSDGTEAGTQLVKDIHAGGGSAILPYYSSPTNVNGTLFFTADDGTTGQELWKSDGTAEGTVLVKDIVAGSGWSTPSNLTDVNGTLFFTAYDDINGYELWKSDGTEAGTMLLKDIHPGSLGSSPLYLTNVNGTLFFIADDGTTGHELWKSDGTEAGTVLVTDIYAGSVGSIPSYLTNVNGTLFFAANNGTNGWELWKSDGTEAGTLLVNDIVPGSGSSNFYNLINVNGTLFFTVDDGINGAEIWKTDGTAAGTVLVKDIYAGGGGAIPFPPFVTDVDGTLYFAANDGINGGELWKSDGTAVGTVLVKDIVPGSGSSNFYYNLINVNGTLFFTVDNGINGAELWKSDGTTVGTLLVKDIHTGSLGSNPSNLTDVNGTLFFAADDAITGRELWKSDGTAAGTLLVKDIYAGSGGAILPFYSSLTNVNGTLFFTAYDEINGMELWKSDGTAAGTVLVKDIYAGSLGSYPSSLTNVNGTLFFTITGQDLWKSDGTEAGTVSVADISSSLSYLSNLTNVNGTLFFTAFDGTNGVELWKTDGTAAGTLLVKDIMAGSGSSSPSNLTNVNGTLFFTADDGSTGQELWKSDGTEAGTLLVKDIWAGISWSDPIYLTNVNGTLFFSADDGSTGRELWKSDGTEVGTALVKDIYAGSQASLPSFLTDVNGTLFFAADDGTTGRGLWKSDGTAAGTVLVNEIVVGGSFEYAGFLANVDGTLFFAANDGMYGFELWRSEGIGVLSNDSDPDSLTLTAQLVSGPSHGTLTLNPDGTFVYTPTTGFAGTDTFTYQASDGTYLSTIATVAITVTAVNAPPVVDEATFSLDENSANGTVVGTGTATDPDEGQTLTFSIVGGNSDGAFTIDGSTGIITVANSGALNFETTPVFILVIQATDNGTPLLSGSNTITINLADVNEAPTLTAPTTASVPENTTVVATVSADDPDAGTTLTFSLSGADADKFQLTGTGNTRTLSFAGAPDFEAPTDVDGNNVYQVFVTVSDGVLAESQAIAVTVTDVNEGTTPYIIQGTNKADQIIVKEEDNGWLAVTVNDKTSRVQLQNGQELQVLGLGGDDHIVLQGLNRNALVDGGNGNDKIIAYDVTNPLAALTLLGGKGNDVLVGGRGNDILRGGDGNDILIGWEGDDLLDGGPGNDVLVGGPGQDTLIGGGGKDILLRRGALVTKAWIKEFVGVHD